MTLKLTSIYSVFCILEICIVEILIIIETAVDIVSDNFMASDDGGSFRKTFPSVKLYVSESNVCFAY